MDRFETKGNGMNNIWHEMRRRHVLRIGGVYVAAAWVFIEMLSIFLPMFEAPGWIAKTFTVLVVLCFPIALIIAWAFEVTPDGIRIDNRPNDPKEVVPTVFSDYLIVLGLVIVIGLSTLEYFTDGDSLSSDPVTVALEAETEASLAVLPFLDFSEGADNQYLGNGIAESVLNSLAKLDGLKVASRTSSFAVQNKNLEIGEIGERLGVAQTLEGSIRLLGDKLRVSVQLSDVKTGYQIWSKVYDREFDDIFAIEEDIARSLVAALKGPLSLDDDPVVDIGTNSPQAYSLSLEGRYYFNIPTQDNFLRAMQLFQEAIEIDPGFAMAHGYLGFTLGYASIYTSYADFRAASAVSTELALLKEPDNVPATLIKAFMYRNLDKAFPLYKQALENGGDTDLALYTFHNDYLWPQSRHLEARQPLLTALEDDPESVLLLQPLAMLESRAGNPEKALAYIAKVGPFDGADFLISSVLADVYYRNGDGVKLRKIAEQSIDFIGWQNGFLPYYLLQAHLLNGDRDLANLMLEEMLEKQASEKSLSATTIGLSFAALGRLEEAVKWLIQAQQEKDFWLRWHLRGALEDFPRLAQRPKMVRLVEDMGLDDASIQGRIALSR